jgi:Mg2+-importing ATPase
MVVSVTLTRGALRMAALKVIVKRPTAIQDMGAMDVLCTHKKGTLTEARIELEQHIDPQGQASERVLQLPYLTSYFESGLKSPLDDSILQHSEVDVRNWSKIDEVPFDFERRRVWVLLEPITDGKKDGQRQLIVKGAPEDILQLCSRYEAANGQPQPLDATARGRIEALFNQLGEQGLRVLGVAWRDE